MDKYYFTLVCKIRKNVVELNIVELRDLKNNIYKDLKQDEADALWEYAWGDITEDVILYVLNLKKVENDR